LNIENVMQTNCHHDFCYDCTFKLLSNNTHDVIQCPLCRTHIKHFLVHNIRIQKDLMNVFQ
jgi:hypothetical protein